METKRSTSGNDSNSGDSPLFPLSTIQKAIDLANSGFTVIVQDGTYTGTGNRMINFNGKEVTLKSENGADSCIIDCENADRAFVFENQEGQNTILNGFQIINGKSIDNNGAGIYCYDSSPKILNCIIRNNETELSTGDLTSLSVTYCNVEEGWDGEGNIDTDPFFADPNNGDYHLQSQAGRYDPTAQSWVQDSSQQRSYR